MSIVFNFCSQNLKIIAAKAANLIDSGGQVVVSCQSGRGRSGTFSAMILGNLHNASTHSELVDIIVGIREHRDGLVETPAQYRFIAESLAIPNTLTDDCSSASCTTGNDDGGGGSITVKPHHYFLRSGIEVLVAFILGVVCTLSAIWILQRRKLSTKQTTTYQSIVDNSIHNSSL